MNRTVSSGLPEPHFVPPGHQCAAGPRGMSVGIGQPGTGGLAEARLLLPLAPVHKAHATSTKVLSEVLRSALEAEVGALAVVRVEVRGDRSVIALRTFREDLAAVCGRVAASLTSDALFEPGPVRRAAARVDTALSAADGHPAVVARAGFLTAVYGTHPYGGSARRAELDGVVGAALAALVAGVPATERRVVVVGPGTSAGLLEEAAPLLPGTPTGTASPPTGPEAAPDPLPGPSGREPATLVLPSAPQTLIRLGSHVPGRADPVYPALQLAVLMLGGYFGSRLTRVLREREGLAYAPRAVLDPLGRTAAFTIEADVRTDGAARSLALIRGELDRLAAGSFPAEELSNACNYAVGSMAMAFSSRSGTASGLTGIFASGLAPDWLQGYERRLREVSADDVARIAARHLHQSLTGVVVAPAAAPGLPPVG